MISAIAPRFSGIYQLNMKRDPSGISFSEERPLSNDRIQQLSQAGDFDTIRKGKETVTLTEAENNNRAFINISALLMERSKDYNVLPWNLLNHQFLLFKNDAAGNHADDVKALNGVRQTPAGKTLEQQRTQELDALFVRAKQAGQVLEMGTFKAITGDTFKAEERQIYDKYEPQFKQLFDQTLNNLAQSAQANITKTVDVDYSIYEQKANSMTGERAGRFVNFDMKQIP